MLILLLLPVVLVVLAGVVFHRFGGLREKNRSPGAGDCAER